MANADYPPPRVATIRQLYGSAFRCAHPDCNRPLYRLSDETGERGLNSRVSHIHARRRGGPRWSEMPPAENRAFENLLLLCIEHSYEIDEFPERFPAQTLREWKEAQLAEYDQLQRNWQIDDDEAAEVLAKSDAFDVLHAPSTVELVRRVEALRLLAARTRDGPRSWAQAWQRLRQQVRASFFAWDEDGNPVYAEPAEMQVRPLRDGLGAALTEAVDQVSPAADAARVELAAVRTTRPQVTPWCDALDRAIGALLQEASVWHDSGELTDDAAFETAVVALHESMSELVRASRGEQVPVPETPPVVTEEAEVDPYAAHRALLNQARPFGRVTHRPYDAELRRRVAEATGRASTIPPVASFMAIGLSVTAGLAVAVARNASEAERLGLVDLDGQRTPICAAAALLQETSRDADAHEAPRVADAARDRLRDLWSSTDWDDEAAWIGNDVRGSLMMHAFARVTSDQEVRERLTDALASNPTLLGLLVIACAGWLETRDARNWTDVTGVERSYREIPGWLPTEAIKARAAEALAGSDIASLRDDPALLDAVLHHATAAAT